MDRLYETKLAPFMTQTSHKFWKDRLWYFKQGLYYQGGMVRGLTLLLFFPSKHLLTSKDEQHSIAQEVIVPWCNLAGPGSVLHAIVVKAFWNGGRDGEAGQCAHAGTAARRMGQRLVCALLLQRPRLDRGRLHSSNRPPVLQPLRHVVSCPLTCCLRSSSSLLHTFTAKRQGASYRQAAEACNQAILHPAPRGHTASWLHAWPVV